MTRRRTSQSSTADTDTDPKLLQGNLHSKDVDSTARNAIENTDSRETDVGGSVSEHGEDYGGGADAGGSVGDFGGFGGFDGGA